MNKINTFLVGAQKAGTTSLYDWLGQHKDISAPSLIKDYHFFTKEKLFSKGVSHLESFFQHQSLIRLHCAVNYMFFSKSTAQKIHQYNPNAKIIFCLRNPVDRAKSAYKYFKRTLREDNSFEKALFKELNNELTTHNELSDNTYLEHSNYYNQILDYMKFFHKDNIHFLFFEDLINQEKRHIVMEELCKFLNISIKENFNFKHLNASNLPKIRFVTHLLKNRILLRIVGLLIPFKYRRNIRRFIEKKNVSSKQFYFKSTPQIDAIIKENLNVQLDLLTEITNRDLNILWEQ